MNKKNNKSKSILKSSPIWWVEVIIVGVIIDIFFAYQLGENFVIIKILEPLTDNLYSFSGIKALIYVFSGFLISYFARKLGDEFASTPFRVLLGMDEE